MNGVATPVPAQGELLYTTDSKKLFIGDGITTGGNSAGYFGSVAVGGQDTVYSTGANELLTLIAGDNITITTNSGTNAITINAAAQFDEINNGSIRLTQNNILGLNSNENINIDPSGTGKVVITGALDVSGTITGNLTGSVTGNVSGNAGSVTNGVYTSASYNDPSWITSLAGSKISGNISGSAATVTNGVYTTDVGSVTNTMLANSSITIGSDVLALGDSTTVLSGLAGVTSTIFTGDLVGDVSGIVNGELNTGSIRVFQNNITTLNSNESILINPNGSGILDVVGNVNSTGLTIYSAGQGGASGSGTILVAASSPTSLPLNILESHSTAVLTGGVSFARSRGNILSQQIVQTGDQIQQLVFSGYDGVAYRASSGILASVIGTVGSNIIPGKLDLFVSNSAGTVGTKLELTGSKVSSLVPFKLASYADATARDAYFTGLSISPEAGMMVFLTGTSKFSGYNGATWDDLN